MTKTSPTETPRLSVIITVKNGGESFRDCLEAIKASNYDDYELLVFDDGSSDGSGKLAIEYGATLVESQNSIKIDETIQQFKESIGPAGGRNHAAAVARGEILFFVDADVLVQPTTLSDVVTTFDEQPNISALFGSYDFEPGHQGFISQFRNLLHAFVHQTSQSNAKTFWAGCGAVRKKAFLEVNGFDEQRYRFPAVEDIEFGYRLSEAGHEILLKKSLHVKHLKHWTFSTMLVADVLHRAIPWLRLIYSKRNIPNDLNLTHRNRLSAVVSTLLVLMMILAIIGIPLAVKDISDGVLGHFLGIPYIAWYLGSMIVLAWSFLLLNSDFYLFLFKLRGAWFTFKSACIHCIFFFYSMIALVVFLADYHIPGLRRLRKRLSIHSHVER